MLLFQPVEVFSFISFLFLTLGGSKHPDHFVPAPPTSNHGSK